MDDPGGASFLGRFASWFCVTGGRWRIIAGMHEATIAEIEAWLRACARETARSEAQAQTQAEAEAARDSADAADPAQDQERPFWPYLESEDFWRE